MKRALCSGFFVLALPAVAGAATYKDLEIWTLLTANDLALILLVIGFALHCGQAYYQRLVRQFKLRLSGEHWAVLFLAIRDGSLFLAFAIGILMINPDIMADIKLAVPFIPLGTVALGWALVVHLGWDTDQATRARTLFLGLLALAVCLYLFGYTFVMEAAPTEWLAEGHGRFWHLMRSMRSNENPNLSFATFYVCFPLLVTCFAGFAAIALRGQERVEPPDQPGRKHG